MIKIEHLHKYYNKNRHNEIHVINDTNLEFSDSGMVCILGESGSGKTTLLNTIGGLDSYQSGTLSVNDFHLKKYKPKVIDRLRNEKYSYIFQNYYLLYDQTVTFNIMLSLNMYNISEEEKIERTKYVLEAVGMSKYRKKLVSQLSGGQQQRVAIARALVKSPEVIFADEPTGNLDEQNTIQIMNIIKKISKECLVILVTHEERLAEFYADRIIRIKDGKIVSDDYKTSQGHLTRLSDNNIYLREYHKVKLDNDNLEVNYYSNESIPPIKIDIIYEDGKFFIDSKSDSKIEYLVQNGERKVFDTERPVLKAIDIDQFDYHLDQLKYEKQSRLSMVEIWRLVKNNLKAMRKKQIFLFIVLIVMAAFIIIAVQDILEVKSIPIEQIVVSDSRIIEITVDRTNINDTAYSYMEGKSKYYDEILSLGISGELLPLTNPHLEYYHKGFINLERSPIDITTYSFLPTNFLDSSELIMGRMPERINEVVIDEWILNRLISDGMQLAAITSSIDYFIGKDFTIANKDVTITVVGISRTNNPTIYGLRGLLLTFTSYTKNIAPIAELKKFYDNGDVKIYSKLGEEIAFPELDDNSVLVSKSYFDIQGAYNSRFWPFVDVSTNLNYQIVGYYSDDFPITAVLNDDEFEETLREATIYNKTFSFVTNDQEKILEAIYGQTVDIMYNSAKSIQLKVSSESKYETQLMEYKDRTAIEFNARLVVTITILLVSMIILYFTMKSSAVKMLYPIGVYRSIGISRISIVVMFVVEITVISIFTTGITTLLTTSIFQLLGTIPSIGMTTRITYPITLLIFLAIWILNLLIGLLPIFNILKLPPAQLTSKYDI